MTPGYFREIRDEAELSAAVLARLIGAGSGRTIRKWEAGDRMIPGPVQVLMLLIRDHGPGILRPRI